MIISGNMDMGELAQEMDGLGNPYNMYLLLVDYAQANKGYQDTVKVPEFLWIDLVEASNTKENIGALPRGKNGQILQKSIKQLLRGVRQSARGGARQGAGRPEGTTRGRKTLKSLGLDAKTWKWLEEKAKERATTTSAVVRMAISQHIEREQQLAAAMAYADKRRKHGALPPMPTSQAN